MSEAVIQEARTYDRSCASIEEFRNYIDGNWVRSGSKRLFDNINPAEISDVVGRFQASTASDASAGSANAPGGRAPVEPAALRADASTWLAGDPRVMQLAFRFAF